VFISQVDEKKFEVVAKILHKSKPGLFADMGWPISQNSRCDFI